MVLCRICLWNKGAIRCAKLQLQVSSLCQSLCQGYNGARLSSLVLVYELDGFNSRPYINSNVWRTSTHKQCSCSWCGALLDQHKMKIRTNRTAGIRQTWDMVCNGFVKSCLTWWYILKERLQLNDILPSNKYLAGSHAWFACKKKCFGQMLNIKWEPS